MRFSKNNRRVPFTQLDIREWSFNSAPLSSCGAGAEALIKALKDKATNFLVKDIWNQHLGKPARNSSPRKRNRP